jgi:N-dimethylarginine dimethylaminohydrolase
MSETSLRDYRHRDKKFAYIRKGHQIYYPLHVNKQIIREMKDERDDWIGDIND